MTIRRSSSPSARKPEALAIAERLEASGSAGKPLYGVPFVVKDNIDVAGLPTTAACPAFAYRPGTFGVRRRAARARWRNRHRQDQPRSVRDRARRRTLALRRSAQCAALGSHSRRIELRLGDGGRRGPRSVFARHRHGGIGARAGGAQRHCRAEAVARRSLRLRRRPGLPHARHGLDLRPRCRRRLRRLSGGDRVRRTGRLQPLVP